MSSIELTHNFEAAHRLYLTPGKCQAIHGHSFLATIRITGTNNGAGLLEGLDFGEVKKVFRGLLDTGFDHRLLLNSKDPWTAKFGVEKDLDQLPGLTVLEDMDPTTENLAELIAGEMLGWLSNRLGSASQYIRTRRTIPALEVYVQETKANAASSNLLYLPDTTLVGEEVNFNGG
jgi:6-pyruvoyltetrahydropterin/6-carboxytetrahydropterin synthase